MKINLQLLEYETLKFEFQDNTVLVKFNRSKDTNPFNRKMTNELKDFCQRVQENNFIEHNTIRSMILTGNVGRSFSVGGDFNDIKAIKDSAEIRVYIGEILDLYVALLNVPIPVISAVDGFAIGQGMQVVLLTDWRIGSSSCQLQMPELKHGIACPVGSIILETMFGRAQMLKQVIGCEFISIKECLQLGVFNQIVESENLLEAAFSKAQVLNRYPKTSFQVTKKIQNDRFVQAIKSVYDLALDAHENAFIQKTGNTHFDAVLNHE